MTDGKTIFHIEVKPENARLVWSVLSENLQLIIDKMQHSVDGKDLNVYLRIDEKEQ